MDNGASGDVPQGQAVAGLDVRAAAGEHFLADLQLGRRQDVALLTISVVKEGDIGRPVRVVLDRHNLGRHTGLLTAQVDLAVAALVAAAPEAAGGSAIIIPPAGAALPLGLAGQRRLITVKVREIINSAVPASR